MRQAHDRGCVQRLERRRGRPIAAVFVARRPAAKRSMSAWIGLSPRSSRSLTTLASLDTEQHLLVRMADDGRTSAPIAVAPTTSSLSTRPSGPTRSAIGVPVAPYRSATPSSSSRRTASSRAPPTRPVVLGSPLERSRPQLPVVLPLPAPISGSSAAQGPQAGWLKSSRTGSPGARRSASVTSSPSRSGQEEVGRGLADRRPDRCSASSSSSLASTLAVPAEQGDDQSRLTGGEQGQRAEGELQRIAEPAERAGTGAAGPAATTAAAQPRSARFRTSVAGPIGFAAPRRSSCTPAGVRAPTERRSRR